MRTAAPAPKMPTARALDLSMAAATLLALRFDRLRKHYRRDEERYVALGALASDVRDIRRVLRIHRRSKFTGEAGGFSAAEVAAMKARVGEWPIVSGASARRASRRCAAFAAGLHTFALSAAEDAGDEDVAGALRVVASGALELAGGIRRAVA